MAELLPSKFPQKKKGPVLNRPLFNYFFNIKRPGIPAVIYSGKLF